MWSKTSVILSDVINIICIPLLSTVTTTSDQVNDFFPNHTDLPCLHLRL